MEMIWGRTAQGKQVILGMTAWRLTGIVLLGLAACQGVVRAQQLSVPQPNSVQQEPKQPTSAARPIREEAVKNPVAPCLEPPPGLRWDDFNGTFAKSVGVFARKLERKSIHGPRYKRGALHYKPGELLCTLATKDKFKLFVADTLDPATFLGAGFNAGISQAENNSPSYGQGAAGYGKRMGANMAGQSSSEFFKDFAYPTIFSEDPRYYRLAHGSGEKRFLHAMAHAFVTYRVDGTYGFNLTEWLGTTSAVVLSNTYRPNNRRGFFPAAQRVGYGVSSDAGFDILREFWPEIARKFGLAYRGQHEPMNPVSSPGLKNR